MPHPGMHHPKFLCLRSLSIWATATHVVGVELTLAVEVGGIWAAGLLWPEALVGVALGLAAPVGLLAVAVDGEGTDAGVTDPVQAETRAHNMSFDFVDDSQVVVRGVSLCTRYHAKSSE